MANDPYKYFRIEARELADQLGRETLELEKSPSAPERVAQLLRLAHTLKGAARVVKQAAIAERAHSIEDALAPFREGAAVTRECVDRLLKWIDEIGAGVDALGEPVSAAANAGEPRAASDDHGRTLRADLSEVDALLEGLAEASVLCTGLGSGIAGLGRAQDLARRISVALRAGQAGRPAEGAPLRPWLDDLERCVGRAGRDLAIGAEQLERELGQLRESAERLRLLPAEYIFHALERTLRDAAAAMGRSVRFEARGGDVRLDADVLGAVQGALVQAVRNAVAHGIEPPDERTALGKPREGSVSIEVVHAAGRVTFRCRDDGRGIDLESVRRAAQRQGLAAADVQALGADALLARLLEGGLSTARAVTEISGRGVGLDVVRDAAQRLGGRVSVQTEPGRGMSLALSVPISLVALQTLCAEVAGQVVAVPLEAVRSTLRLPSKDLVHSAERTALAFGGELLPFAPLARALRAAPREPRSDPNWSVIVLESGGVRAALGVDRLRGVERLVARPLPAGTPADPVVAGASLDASGNPQLVLDPAGLLAAVLQGGASAPLAAAERRALLVIDDSMTTRMLEQSILESAGYEVDLAASAEEGLEKAQRRDYALFLVDVEMPGMDGFSFIERTRSAPALQHVPSILMTSLSSPEHRQRGAAVGARAYFVKSEFDQAALLARIRELVGS